MGARTALLPRAERPFRHAPGSRATPAGPPPPASASASHAPLRSSRICAPVQQAVGASGHFRSRAAIRAAAAVEELPWQGQGRGKARAGQGVKPEPPRGGSRGRRREKRSRGQARGSSLLSRRPLPARAPEMHLHQVLTGAVNPGDNCYSVGSVGDVPFTVSGVGSSRGRDPGPRSPSRPTPPRGGTEGPTCAPFAAQFRGAGVGL